MCRLRANYAKEIRKFVNNTPKFDYGALTVEERKGAVPAHLHLMYDFFHEII